MPDIKKKKEGNKLLLVGKKKKILTEINFSVQSLVFKFHNEECLIIINRGMITFCYSLPHSNHKIPVN